MREIVRELNAVEFLFQMDDESLLELVSMGEIELFCNALTIDLAEIEHGFKSKNQA